jgi:hypothetical protein
MEIASRNAALPVEQGGLGLPENNTPMDRARAMGFDVDNPLYHSTNADIERFEPSRKGKFGTGIYTSPDVSMSEKYLPSGEGQNVMPLFQRGEALDSRGNDQGQLARLGVKQGQDLEDWMYPRSERKKGADPFAKLNKASAEAGFTSVNYPSPWYENVVVDPKALRSRFAAFDPMRRNEADLLAFNSGGRGLLDVPNFERLYGLIGQ